MNSVESTMKTPMEQVDELKYWLATAPVNWELDQNIRRYLLPTGEYISCVLWNSLYHITGTDIVRSLVFRFQAFGRPVKNIKKFEEGVFSDLRNLKPGMDASLEEPKSEFLEMLYKNNCIRTQKKQKVFYWFSVPHDRLFLDALERDLKREKMGIDPTTVAIAEPALSFSFDSTQSLYDQFTKGMSPSSSAPSSPQLRGLVYDSSIPPMAPSMIGSQIKTDDPSGVLYSLDQESMGNATSAQPSLGTFALFQPSIPDNTMVKPQMYPSPDLGYCSMDELQKGPFEANTPPEYFVSGSPWSSSSLEDHYVDSRHPSPDHLEAGLTQTIVPSSTAYNNPAATAANLFGMFSIFEGSPTYKQRRRRANSCNNVNVNNNNNNNSTTHRSNATPYPLKTYTCPLPTCGRLFKRLEHLKRHVRTHTMERPYSCQVCGKRFSRSDNLAQHRKTHERGMSNSPPPSDDGSNTSDLGYEEGVVNDCYSYDSSNITPSCVPNGLAVYTTSEHANGYPLFQYPQYLEGNTGNGIIV